MPSILKTKSLVMWVAGFFCALLLAGSAMLTQAVEMIPISCCKTPLTILSTCAGQRTDLSIVRYQIPACLTQKGLKIYAFQKLSDNTFKLEYRP
jgi:hypothetical protein